MTAAQVTHDSSPDPLSSPNAGRGTRITESQGSISRLLRVEVTVLRAHSVPRIKDFFSRKRRFFVSVVNDATVMETKSVQIDGRTVQWDQTLGAFSAQRSSHLILRLYAKRSTSPNILIGSRTTPIPVVSQSEVAFVLNNDGRGAGQSTQPVTLYLTITVTVLPNVPSESPIIPNNPSSEETTTLSIVPDTGGPFHSTVPDALLSTPDPLSIETDTPIAHGQDKTPPTEKALVTRRLVDEAIDRKNRWKETVSRIKWVMDAVSPIAELSPFAKMAYGLVSAIPKILLEQYERDENILALVDAMHHAFDFAHHEDTLKSTKPDSKQAEILTLMLRDICSCGDFIQSYVKDSQFWKRTFKNIGGGVAKDIEALSAALIEHRKAFVDHTTITTEITAFQILDGVGILSARVDWMSAQLKWVSSQVSDAKLNAEIREIPHGKGSRFTSEKACLPGTRTAFLDFIVDWVDDPDSKRTLVLFGQAGMGKSSIAHEIARRFDKMHRLTSSYIFLRNEQSEGDAYHLFTTLARDFSDRYPSFKAALGEAIKDNSSLVLRARDYPTLFESLILEPLRDLHIVGPILVVIDALDESGDVTGRNGLHNFLAKNLSRLPSNFRVLITSRPEDSIQSAFDGVPAANIKYMNDPQLAAQTDDDILTFLQNLLPSGEFEKHGVALVKKAEGLFQWAAVASRFILDPPECFGLSMKRCINHLLNPTTDRDRQDPLDDLYKDVLKGYFTHPETRLLFRSIVGQLIASIEPLTIRSLITLRQHASYSDDDDDGGAVVKLFRRLGSLLSNVNSTDQNLPVIPLHTSFRDFLTNKEKSGDFCVSLQDAHRQLAHSCLGLLLKDLKFNICNLESSYLANKDVEDLNSRVDEHIPPALLYACRFWGNHLEHIGFETDLFGKLRTFFEKKLLFWLETLSLTSDMSLAPAACSTLNVWLASGQDTESKNFRSFVSDTSAFIRYFGGAMAKSAPHVYLSALPFAPTDSLISAHYSSTFPRILRVERGRLSQWLSSELVISTIGDRVTNWSNFVNSVALSPDGQRIVSGSDDGTIRVWNSTTGEREAGQFTGHTKSVRSVEFSPDGQRIVSGSSDRTIRVWNAATGETETGPFTGHTGVVTSVRFSPDGQRIVSGSWDRTIRVWDAKMGETEAGPFAGHTDPISSVGFSPDGQRIVSGSYDGTIRVWNIFPNTTGETNAGPFTGHTGVIKSVGFSPDGQRIVSGSWDRTIRVWDAKTGETEAGPFAGHTDPVSSVGFSLDGQRIISGSYDGTIRVWNVTTGETEAGPFTGHTGVVTSVGFSPDGRHIISGSWDRTIRVWNANTEETGGSPFTRHAQSVRSVGFSPDGQRIVSGSSDGTIRIWNATTGETVAGPFTGHTGLAWSVGFSPDGQRIVSGSFDRTIRVWNATTGETEVGPFTGHTDLVASVGFSPDGRRIVSGSWDRTIRVWDAKTGETEAGPFSGHEDSVSSVGFSPDGQRIVSGSYDGTIRVWNATTGETEAGPFTGHTDSVTSVGFSPDGQRVISGSEDRTIRVWDATTGETEAGPFTGHAESVTSVGFSPDGRRVVSGSSDRTTRVWNATTGETEAGPFSGHTSWVGSVAFSPDGQHIISSGGDASIRMLNVTTGNRETTRPVDFTDHSAINDEGWICGSRGELLMWIPPVHRTGLHRPSDIWVASEYKTRIDLSTFVHGHSWATCVND